jgi:ectoine hydroxylase-related dioxygenase (phytanoyl-CoA dioxygenase family)
VRDSKPNSLLVGENARRADVNQAWEQDNQAWWDWYVTLAENGPPSTARDVDALRAADLEQVLLAESSQPPDEVILNELATPFALHPDAVASFQRNGFVKLQNVLSRAAVSRLRCEMVRLLEAQFDIKMNGGTRERFLSMEMVWLENLLIRAFVLSPRIAGICAALLDVPRVRLYHDNLLSKEPGCGRTPWHYDDHHFPLATQQVVTAWIPAQPIPRSMGPLTFAAPIESWQLVRDIEFSKFDTSYDRQVSESFRKHRVAIDDSPFALGEVSFHHNLSFHTAGANHTDISRLVLANTYYVDGARVVNQPTMVSGDWQKFIPDTAPGAVAASPLNPVCWPADASKTAAIGGQPLPRNSELEQ